MERLLDNVSSAPAEVDCVEHARLLGLDVVEEEEQRVEQVVPPGRELQPTTAALAAADLKEGGRVGHFESRLNQIWNRLREFNWSFNQLVVFFSGEPLVWGKPSVIMAVHILLLRPH